MSHLPYQPGADSNMGNGQDKCIHDSEYGFYGYRREDGRAGVRNEIWIIPTVGCVGNHGHHCRSGAGLLTG